MLSTNSSEDNPCCECIPVPLKGCHKKALVYGFLTCVGIIFTLGFFKKPIDNNLESGLFLSTNINYNDNFNTTLSIVIGDHEGRLLTQSLPDDTYGVFQPKLKTNQQHILCDIKPDDKLTGCTIHNFNDTSKWIYFQCYELEKDKYNCVSKHDKLNFHCFQTLVVGKTTKNLTCNWRFWNEGTTGTTASSGKGTVPLVTRPTEISYIKQRILCWTYKINDKEWNIVSCNFTDFEWTQKNVSLKCHKVVNEKLATKLNVHSLHNCVNKTLNIIRPCAVMNDNVRCVTRDIWKLKGTGGWPVSNGD